MYTPVKSLGRAIASWLAGIHCPSLISIQSPCVSVTVT